MSIDLLKNIASTAPENTALLGMDVGKKTIGLAVCDPAWMVATPLTTIKRTKFSHDVAALLPYIREYEVGGFVIGLPVNMDGSEGVRCQSIRDFAIEFSRRVEIVGENPWIALWDERLSTVSVEEFVDTSVEKRKIKAQSKSSGLIDKLAAQHILQGAIEYLGKN
jgi:putative Holliday junction resolvase